MLIRVAGGLFLADAFQSGRLWPSSRFTRVDEFDREKFVSVALKIISLLPFVVRITCANLVRQIPLAAEDGDGQRNTGLYHLLDLSCDARRFYPRSSRKYIKKRSFSELAAGTEGALNYQFSNASTIQHDAFRYFHRDRHC
jgi:hypothetical protein